MWGDDHNPIPIESSLRDREFEFPPFLWFTSQPSLLAVSSHQMWWVTLYVQEVHRLRLDTQTTTYKEYNEWYGCLHEEEYGDMVTSCKLLSGQGIGRLCI